VGLGRFDGRLVDGHTSVLPQVADSTEFSNIHGLTVIKIPKANIMTVSEEIGRVLEREGLVK
jgi:hypothetical protein